MINETTLIPYMKYTEENGPDPEPVVIGIRNMPPHTKTIVSNIQITIIVRLNDVYRRPR